MKSPYISELQPNQIITGVFLVQHKDIRRKRTGEPYLSLILADRTGELEAKMWDNVSEVMDTFDRDDFLKVRGQLQVYQNRRQLTVHRLQRQDASTLDLADFFPASQRDPDQMLSELRGIIAALQNPHLRALLELMFNDPEIAQRYKVAPAAKSVHHAYLGGLIEHVLSMCGLARFVASHYPDIDLDLLLAGVILHDVGKIYELSYERGFHYTSEGQLLGHIFIGLRMLDEKMRQLPDFPAKLRTLLEHMIISHHGELEFGSPRPPSFPEALLLHYIDNIDSKLECMRASIHNDRYLDGCWTAYSSPLERTILKKSKFLQEALEEAPESTDLLGTPAGEDPDLQSADPKAVPSPSAPAPPGKPVRPQPQSLFAEKLHLALKEEPEPKG